MKYPGNIRGPRIDQGDLATFTFAGAELTLRLPIIPINRHHEDIVSPIRDFRDVDTSGWESDEFGTRFTTLVQQQWTFEDSISFDNVASCRLFFNIIDVSQLHTEQNALLRTESFEQIILDLYGAFFQSYEHKHLTNPSSPALANRFHGKSIAREHLDWFNVQFCFIEDAMPKPVIMIPISNRFFILAFIDVTSLHYSDRKNPYSDDLLRKFEFDLFDELLRHIDLRYTAETIAIIDSLKKKK